MISIDERFMSAVAAAAIVRDIRDGRRLCAQVIDYAADLLEDGTMLSLAIQAQEERDVGELAMAYVDWQYSVVDSQGKLISGRPKPDWIPE